MLLLLNSFLLAFTAGEECWWSGCQLDSWSEIGCFPEDQWNAVNSTPCIGGNIYKCCRSSKEIGSKNSSSVIKLKKTRNCWWSGCQPYHWGQRGCFPEEDWEAIESIECEDGDKYHCCKRDEKVGVTTKKSVKHKVKAKVKVTAECWWSGCQPSDWGERGCFPSEDWQEMNSTDCEIGDMYFCCRKYGSENRTKSDELESSNPIIHDVDMNLNEFQKAVIDCGYDPPTDYQYKTFTRQSMNRSVISSKRELAMFLAQILWESGGLKYKKEIACEATGCPGVYVNNGCDLPGKSYYGRGYIQLTWCFNYKAASQDLYGDDRLVKEPGLVAENEDIAWETAFWYWKRNVHNKPGVQQGLFGASTKAINGNLECDGQFTDRARKRFELYIKVLNAFNITETPNESGCYD